MSSFACVNVSSSLDHLELIKINEKDGQIEAAFSSPAYFDLTNRSLSDVEQFIMTLKELYSANQVPTNTPTILVLPSFLTREIELPSEFSDEEIRFGLVSEAESSIIFKKQEPEVAWLKLGDNSILYTAYPKIELEKFTQAFEENNIPLIAIDLSYFSIIRGLVAVGAITSELELNSRWCLMVLTDFNFFALIVEGIQPKRSTESILATGESSEMVLISDIKQDFESFYEFESLESVVLVNNTTQIDSQNLVTQLNLSEKVTVIDQNADTLSSRNAETPQFPCSLEALGGGLFNRFQEMPDLNLLVRSGVNMAEVIQLRGTVLKMLIGLNVVAFVLGLLIIGVMLLFSSLKEGELGSLNQEISQAGNPKSDTGNVEEVLRKIFVKKTVGANVSANDILVKAGLALPEDMWLDKFEIEVRENETQPVTKVKGGALETRSVKGYLKGLQDELTRKDLKVISMDVASSDTKQRFYKWRIESASEENN
ncbi:MAG: hypothetical protein KTR14_00765 [Vampirovibrio sp.]|nr:hypothetical protein [Vampirovibrio sp.]